MLDMESKVWKFLAKKLLNGSRFKDLCAFRRTVVPAIYTTLFESKMSKNTRTDFKNQCNLDFVPDLDFVLNFPSNSVICKEKITVSQITI